MIRIWCLGLAFILFGTASVARGQEKYKLPLDTELRRKNADLDRDWIRDSLLGAYERNGVKDPKWDDDVKKALEGLVELHHGSNYYKFLSREVQQAAERAEKAGCKDAMVRYANVRGVSNPARNDPKLRFEKFMKIGRDIRDSCYPAHRKLGVMINAGVNSAANAKDRTDEEKAEIRKLLMATLDMLVESSKKDKRNIFVDQLWHAVSMDLIRSFENLGDETEKAWKTVDAGLARCEDFDAKQFRTKACWMPHFAWEARRDSENGTPEEKYEKYKQRMLQAKELLEQAWDLEPSAAIAERRMWVESWLGDGDREKMEVWFRRAISHTSDDLEAVRAMREWIRPNWHGNKEAYMEFLDACKDAGYHRDGIALIYFEAHYGMALSLPKAEEFARLKNPQFVKDNTKIFKDYLQDNPQDNLNRGRYAVFLFYAEKYKESAHQFDLIGNDMVASTNFPIDFQKTLVKDLKKRVPKGK